MLRCWFISLLWIHNRKRMHLVSSFTLMCDLHTRTQIRCVYGILNLVNNIVIQFQDKQEKWHTSQNDCCNCYNIYSNQIVLQIQPSFQIKFLTSDMINPGKSYTLSKRISSTSTHFHLMQFNFLGFQIKILL